MTYFRAVRTIIGPTCLTAVFGMGTGVATWVRSPEDACRLQIENGPLQIANGSQGCASNLQFAMANFQFAIAGISKWQRQELVSCMNLRRRSMGHAMVLSGWLQ